MLQNIKVGLSARSDRDIFGVVLADITNAVRRPALWMEIGWLDIKQRYRRSTLGPFWITISVAAFVVGLGIIYGGLFRQPLAEYLPRVGIGLIVWMLVAALIIDGCAAFTSAEGAIKQVPIPLSVHVLRSVWRNLIITAHHAIFVAFLIVGFGVPIGWSGMLALPALFLLSVFGIAVAMVFGLLSARFRDIPQIMTNLVQLAFFLTPIIWRADDLPTERQLVAQVNPFHYMISIVRDPLLGSPPPFWYWGVAIGMTLVALVVAFLLFARFRDRIAYWL